jgi:hypothetical protein
MQRQLQKNSGTLTHKKAVAKKLGISIAELNNRLARREQNLKEMEDNNNE